MCGVNPHILFFSFLVKNYEQNSKSYKIDMCMKLQTSIYYRHMKSEIILVKVVIIYDESFNCRKCYSRI